MVKISKVGYIIIVIVIHVLFILLLAVLITSKINSVFEFSKQMSNFRLSFILPIALWYLSYLIDVRRNVVDTLGVLCGIHSHSFSNIYIYIVWSFISLNHQFISFKTTVLKTGFFSLHI